MSTGAFHIFAERLGTDGLNINLKNFCFSRFPIFYMEVKKMTIYDYSVRDAQGNDVPIKDYKGKVLLIVNTATKCGFTPHYKELEQMYEKYHAQGLEIIDVPCNQFGEQAPGTNEQISEFCSLNYNTKFPQMKS